MPEAPVISTAAVASSDQGDEGSTSEGSSTEPGDEPGDIRTILSSQHRAAGSRSGAGPAHGAMLLSQLRRR